MRGVGKTSRKEAKDGDKNKVKNPKNPVIGLSPVVYNAQQSLISNQYYREFVRDDTSTGIGLGTAAIIYI